MTEENRQHNLAKEWEKGEEAWREGELLMSGSLSSGAVTRFYYAAFHAVCAVLLTEGLEAATHAGARTLLSKHFVHTGKLPRDLVKVLAGLQQLREDADYDRNAEFDVHVAEDVRTESDRVRTILGDWLRANGWL